MSTNQSWGGRFAEGPREAVAAYTDSQTYDRALYAQDIRGSQAHARMPVSYTHLTLPTKRIV